MKTKPRTSMRLSAANKKIDTLLAQKNITVQDLTVLNDMEREYFGEKATAIVAQLKGTARDAFLQKMTPIVATYTKNDIWEQNHLVISRAIASFMQQHGIMPTKTAIAEQTGLSRQTVATHFKLYKQHPEFLAQIEQFKFMSHNILATVFKQANSGDIRAARLYFEMLGDLNKQPAATVVKEQNNYLQINNTILSQEQIKQLSPAQLTQIENIVMNKEMKVLA